MAWLIDFHLLVLGVGGNVWIKGHLENVAAQFGVRVGTLGKEGQYFCDPVCLWLLCRG